MSEKYQQPQLMYSDKPQMQREGTQSSKLVSPRSQGSSRMPSHDKQPSHTEMMLPTSGGARNARNMALKKNGKRDWSNGLCDYCDDCGTCRLACHFASIVYGENKTRLTHLTNQGRPHPTGGDGLGSDCLIHFFCCGWICQIGERKRVRERYDIDGNCCYDCCAVCFCGPCALTQESREIQLEEETMFP